MIIELIVAVVILMFLVGGLSEALKPDPYPIAPPPKKPFDWRTAVAVPVGIASGLIVGIVVCVALMSV